MKESARSTKCDEGDKGAVDSLSTTLAPGTKIVMAEELFLDIIFSSSIDALSPFSAGFVAMLVSLDGGVSKDMTMKQEFVNTVEKNLQQTNIQKLEPVQEVVQIKGKDHRNQRPSGLLHHQGNGW